MSGAEPLPRSEPSFGKGHEALHQELQALAFQRNELRLANRRLNAQVAAATILFTHERVEDALPPLIEALCAVFDWDLGLYWFRGPRGLQCGYAFPEEALGPEGLSGLPFPIPEDGLSARAYASGEVLWTFDLREVTELGGWAQPYACAFAIPVVGERSHGALLFLGRSFLEAEKEFLEGLLAVGASFGRFIDRRLLLAELGRTRDAALAANRSKTQFLANLSHELRTPLHAVLGLSDLLLQESLEPRQHQLMGEVKDSGRKLLRMVNDLLAFAQLQSRRARPEPHPFSFAALIDSLEDHARIRALEKGLAFRVEIDARLPQWMHADDTRIRQALLPLLDNALRFTEQGSVLLKAVQEERSEEQVRLTFVVSDTGPGIPDAQLARVMQPFHQADTSDTRTYGGLGLGLSMAQEVASMLGGRVHLASELGHGSTATLTLTVDIAKAPAPSEPSKVKLQGRVLVVEDNPINQLVATSLLTALGLTHEVAEDGAVALKKLAQGGFDMVLMDCQMPVMDGWEATRRYRASETEGHLPIVALTASSTEDDMGRCKASGMDDFLAKPVDLDVLSHMLQRHLNQ